MSEDGYEMIGSLSISCDRFRANLSIVRAYLDSVLGVRDVVLFFAVFN